MGKMIGTNSLMKKFLLIFLSITCYTAHAEFNLSNYKNCSPIDIDDTKLDLSINTIPKENLYSTKKYRFISLPVANDSGNYCLIINDQNKVIVDAIPKMIENMCGGRWDKKKSEPVWIDDIAGGRGSVIYFYYNTTHALKNINRKDLSAIQGFITTIHCQLSTYTYGDVIELNDTAFYLYQLGYHEASLEILKKVIQLDPNRTVAYLNMADVYLALNNHRQAKQNYLIYANKMKNARLTQQIPKRILKYL
jgi:tetratricopeptide (TPR) repeat protein